MSKLWRGIVLVALVGLAGKAVADTQVIRLSGDIRLRGYFIDRGGIDTAGAQDPGNASFIAERTRVCLEADLVDHALVVVTLHAEGLWGGNNATSDSAGAGTAGTGSSGALNRRFDLGLDEAYLQLNELFSSPTTMKLGRQYLNYGRGLIISSYDQEYNFDAARLVLDFYPLTIDVVGAELVNNQGFTATPSHAGANNLLFVNARYELSNSMIKDLEAYVGYVTRSASSAFSTRVPPTDPQFAGDASPWVIGVRGDLTPLDTLNLWFEGVYEGGADGTAVSLTDPDNKSISAFLFNLGGRFTMKDVRWTPVLNGNYIFASGGGQAGHSSFRPWFDYQEGYNGYLLAPYLSNIHILNLGASIKPCKNSTLSVQGYYYMHAANSPYGGYSNPNIDFGGLSFTPLDDPRDLGWEVDGICGYDYSKDVRLQLVYAAFIPSNAYRRNGFSETAQEVRGELEVKF